MVCNRIALAAMVGLLGTSSAYGASLSIGQGENARVTHVGTVTSQGDTTMNTGAARSAFNVNGSGIKIGIISDSFNKNGIDLSSAIANGDLPGPGNPNGFNTPVQIINEEAINRNIDEGRAMAEIVHDIAPGAQILFHSAFNNDAAGTSDQTIANAIDGLVAAGCNIIVDDVGWIIAPSFQDGFAAQAVNNARNAGVAYFSAAGNNFDNTYQGTFSGGAGGAHDFDTGPGVSENLTVTVPSGVSNFVLQWSQPYESVGGTNQSSYQLNFPGIGTIEADPNDPYAWGWVNNPFGPSEIEVQIEHVSGVSTDKIKLTMYNNATSFDPNFTNSPSFFGHAAAEGGMAVAALSVFEAGQNNVEWFSSLGPATILFDEDGNPINEQRFIDITGPDGANNSFFGFDSASDADSFPNFFGTSAAAPHVAALAALILERAADLGITLSPDDVYNILQSTAVDIESTGFDDLSGAGRVDAMAALNAVPEPTTVSILVLGGLLTLRRRRAA